MFTTIKKVLIAILVLVLLAAVLLFVPRGEKTAKPASYDDEIFGGIKIRPNLDFSLPWSTDPKDVAWEVFQKYLEYNKSQNLEGVKSTVYKISPVCEDPKTSIDCTARMGAAYKYGSKLNKDDFVNIWSDENQTILASNFKINEDDASIGRNRSIIFFVKDNGVLKMLSFSPIKGATVQKGNASREELIDRITGYTEDKDNDGTADYDEECLSVKEGQTCVKTNPTLRDTDGNGFWDGVQALIDSMK